MRITRVVLMVLLLCGVANSATVYPVDNILDSLQKACLYQLRGDTLGTRKDMTNDMIRYGLNTSLIRVCKEFPALEKLDTLVVYKEDEGAALPTDFDRMKQVFRMKGDTLRIPLEFRAIESLRQVTPTTEENLHELDELLSPQWAYSWADRFYLHPKYAIDSSEIDSFLILYYAMDAGMDTSGATTAIDSKYIDVLLLATFAKLSAMKLDFTSAAYYETLYKAELEQ